MRSMFFFKAACLPSSFAPPREVSYPDIYRKNSAAFFFSPEMVSHYVIHAVSLLRAILLLWPPKSWDYRHMPPCPASLGCLCVSMTLNLWHFQSQHSSFFQSANMRCILFMFCLIPFDDNLQFSSCR